MQGSNQRAREPRASPASGVTGPPAQMTQHIPSQGREQAECPGHREAHSRASFPRPRPSPSLSSSALLGSAANRSSRVGCRGALKLLGIWNKEPYCPQRCDLGGAALRSLGPLTWQGSYLPPAWPSTCVVSLLGSPQPGPQAVWRTLVGKGLSSPPCFFLFLGTTDWPLGHPAPTLEALAGCRS